MTVRWCWPGRELQQAGTVPTVPRWVGPVKPHPDMPAGLALGPVPMTRERHFGGSWLVLAGHKRTGGSSVFSFVPPGIQLGELLNADNARCNPHRMAARLLAEHQLA